MRTTHLVEALRVRPTAFWVYTTGMWFLSYPTFYLPGYSLSIITKLGPKLILPYFQSDFWFDSQFTSSSRLFSFSVEDLTLDPHRLLSLLSVIFSLPFTTHSSCLALVSSWDSSGEVKRRGKVRDRDEGRKSLSHWLTAYRERVQVLGSDWLWDLSSHVIFYQYRHDNRSTIRITLLSAFSQRMSWQMRKPTIFLYILLLTECSFKSFLGEDIVVWTSDKRFKCCKHSAHLKICVDASSWPVLLEFATGSYETQLINALTSAVIEMS